jgi:hypothetical protein
MQRSAICPVTQQFLVFKKIGNSVHEMELEYKWNVLRARECSQSGLDLRTDSSWEYGFSSINRQDNSEFWIKASELSERFYINYSKIGKSSSAHL